MIQACATNRYQRYGRRCFAVAGPSTCTSLPDSLRGSALSPSIFRHQLKTHYLHTKNDETYLALALVIILQECAI